MTAPLRFPNRASASVAKTAAANLVPVRQRTQFTCMASSMSMCLGALGLRDCSEDTVNRVMGAAPMRGAAWEQALATAQHYGVRATLTVPATLSQVKEWTDAGKPVMIGWNPEGREWSHASVIFDVQPCPTHGFMVHIADPNCPDPEQVVRVVPKGEFYAKWYEKFPNYLVRRPALMLEREVTPEGRQVMASFNQRSASEFNWRGFGADLRAAFDKTKVPTRAVTGEALAPKKLVRIELQFGRDYDERPGWNDDKVAALIHKTALKHGLKSIGYPGEKYSTPDGWTLVVEVMASSFGGSPERLAAQTPVGRQVMVPMKPVAKRAASVLMDEPLTVPVSEVPVSKQAKSPVPVVQKKNPNVVRGEAPAGRNPVVQGLIERGTSGAGKHKNKGDYDRGHARAPKHRGEKGWGSEYMALPVEEAEHMQDHAAKFEQGVSADPTKNMSEADAAEWKKQNAMHRDQFKAAAKREFGLNALAAFMRSFTGGGRGLPVKMESVRPNVIRILAGSWRDTPEEEVAYWVSLANEYFPKLNAQFDRSGSVDQRWKLLVAPYFQGAKGHGDIIELIPTHRPTPTRFASVGLLPSEAARLRSATTSRTAGLEDACWEGYEAVGMKEQGGKQVPNCVPTKTAARDDSAFVPFPDFWLLPGSVKMKMKQKVEGMGLRFTPHRDGVGLHTPLPATPADKRNLAHAVQVLEEAVRNRPAKTAAHRLDGVRGHQLLPATVARKLPAIYSQENVDDPVAQVKLFSPYSGAVWYLTEYDPSSKQAFGWADLGMGGGELGYIDLTDLEGLNRRGLPLVERDLYWKPMPLSRAKHSRTASQHHAKFPRGEKMTVDEVAAVVGPEFKGMNENPPEAVLAIRREMGKQARNWTPEQRLLTALGAVAEAVQHAGLLAREAPQAARDADKALKLLEAGEQVLGRDVARNLSLPAYR